MPQRSNLLNDLVYLLADSFPLLGTIFLLLWLTNQSYTEYTQAIICYEVLIIIDQITALYLTPCFWLVIWNSKRNNK